MISYLDKTFCSQEKCKNGACHRRLSSDIREGAKRHGLPLAFQDFLNTDCCKRAGGYKEEKGSD